jgi:hypothetical protein
MVGLLCFIGLVVLITAVCCAVSISHVDKMPCDMCGSWRHREWEHRRERELGLSRRQRRQRRKAIRKVTVG